LAFSGIVPILGSFYPPLKFYRDKQALFLSVAIVSLVFIGWDIFAVLRGHWYFMPGGAGNIWIVGLPLEEALFFVVIPFSYIFIWESLKFIRRGKKS